MPTEMPKPKEKEPQDFIDFANTIAINVAGPLLPLLRSGCGSHAFEKLWPCTVYILIYAGYANTPEIVYWIPVWLVLLIFRRLTHAHDVHSAYRGWPWLGGLFCRRERNARIVEVVLVLAAGRAIDGPVGTFIMLAAAGLTVMFMVDSMVFQARKRAMRDALTQGHAMARMQRGEDVW
jgi:hypothetical protein